MKKSITLIAKELKLAAAQIQCVVDLLEEGVTIPFIARYLKNSPEASTKWWKRAWARN